MAVKAGMQAIVDEVQLNIGNSTLLTEDQIQSILDKNKLYLKSYVLSVQPILITQTYKYYNYQSDYPYLESGSGIFRLFDGTGANITTGFTADYLLGSFTFDNDQAGATRYIDAVTYDFNSAVAQCWRLIQAQTAHLYDFSLEDRKFTRSQWFNHCKSMAEYHASLVTFSGNKSRSIPLIRGDYAINN
jgi:hypothetical protein